MKVPRCLTGYSASKLQAYANGWRKLVLVAFVAVVVTRLHVYDCAKTLSGKGCVGDCQSEGKAAGSIEGGRCE